MAMKFRNDIAGLRCLAIVPVVLFHLGVPHMGGGFVGVDVFFVISGFLITRIVQGDLDAGRFSLARFYERRVRRIFPELFAVIAVVLAVGFALDLPKEFLQLGQSVLWTTLFASNLYFFQHDNYFAQSAQHEPLLHTWSLAVEEQFYLLFPLALAALNRAGRPLKHGVLWAVGLLSLISASLLLNHAPTAAFYLPTSRAWELLIGCLLALEAVPGAGRRWVREGLGALGLVLVVGSAVLADAHQTGLPPAFPAVMGAAMLILAGAGEGSLASRAIGNPVFRYIGLISYSLYLWHWPIMVFYRMTIDDYFWPMDQAVLLPVCFGIAALSQRFIEGAFKTSEAADRASPAPVLWAGLAAMACAMVVGLIVAGTGGMRQRFPADVVRIASYLEYGEIASFRTDRCFLSTGSNALARFDRAECLKRDPGRRNVLLFGDSHAAHLWSGLKAAYPQVNVQQATVAGCPALRHYTVVGEFMRTCDDMRAAIFQSYLPHTKLDAVILSGNWQLFQLDQLRETVAYIRRFQPHVYVVGPIVEYRQPLPRLIALGMLNGKGVSADQRLDGAFRSDKALKAAVEGAGGVYISMLDTLCTPAGACVTQTPDGTPLQFDYGHLTEAGSTYVAGKWSREGWLTALD